MSSGEWNRFLFYVEHDVRPTCKPQRATLAGGPFAWTQKLSGSAFGNKVAPPITRFFLQDEQEPRTGSGHDFIFRDRKVELKAGTEHATEGVFLFQQIRPTQDWDVLLCLGLALNSLTFLTLNRTFVESEIETWRDTGTSIIVPQHKGSRTRNRQGPLPDTFWLWTRPEWEDKLLPYRSDFGPSGWNGQKLPDALIRA